MISGFLWVRLVCKHVYHEPACGNGGAQPRLMAVELADVLFQRSRVFRGLLAPDLTTFLAKTVAATACSSTA